MKHIAGTTHEQRLAICPIKIEANVNGKWVSVFSMDNKGLTSDNVYSVVHDEHRFWYLIARKAESNVQGDR